MKFQLNGVSRPLSAGLTVACLLRAEGYGQVSGDLCGENQGGRDAETTRSGIALAINECVIPRSQWQSVQIQPDDQVDLFMAIAGG